MIKMKVSTKIDLSGLKKLQRQLRNVSVDVGYINSKDHWYSEVPVAQVAANLHYWSPWNDTFMLSESKVNQVNNIVRTELQKLGALSITQVATCVGERAVKQIEVNIQSVTSPPNSKDWADVKTFNKPLVFGSRTGDEPNLISELTFKVG